MSATPQAICCSKPPSSAHRPAATMPAKRRLTAKSHPGDEEAGAEAPAKKAAMDRGEVSRTLSFLKYHARANNRGAEDQTDAQHALQVYQDTAAENKFAFLDQFRQNKGNLKWAYAFDTTTSETKQATVLAPCANTRGEGGNVSGEGRGCEYSGTLDLTGEFGGTLVEPAPDSP